MFEHSVGILTDLAAKKNIRKRANFFGAASHIKRISTEIYVHVFVVYINNRYIGVSVFTNAPEMPNVC